jgi:hypothetical protein
MCKHRHLLGLILYTVSCHRGAQRELVWRALVCRKNTTTVISFEYHHNSTREGLSVHVTDEKTEFREVNNLPTHKAREHRLGLQQHPRSVHPAC